MSKKKKNRKKVRHFTAKDVGRITAYARRDGADDAMLARYIIYALGMGNIPALISRILLIGANAILIGTYYYLVRGITYIAKGVTILYEAGLWTGTFFTELISFIEVYLDVEFVVLTKGQWLVWIGSIQSSLAAAIILFDSYADTIIYFRFLDKVTNIKIESRPFKIIPKDFNPFD